MGKVEATFGRIYPSNYAAGVLKCTVCNYSSIIALDEIVGIVLRCGDLSTVSVWIRVAKGATDIISNARSSLLSTSKCSYFYAMGSI